MAKFFDPHPNDGTGPGVRFPPEVKRLLDLCDGQEFSVAFVVGELERACCDIGIYAEATAHGDYIGLRTFPNGRGAFPQHNWRAIRYQE